MASKQVHWLPHRMRLCSFHKVKAGRRPQTSHTYHCHKKVKSLIQELGLSRVAGAHVGDDRVHGISGGEKRRVSISVDVIHDPKVLILDEATSGLDSTSALQIIDMVKTMAETCGRTVILSIHQPGFRIVKLFNTILLLANCCVWRGGSAWCQLKADGFGASSSWGERDLYVNKP
ncbi:hypothetical protein FH972_010957 [Carpinus fangiana]|uniref:ABC transporter domain-containing protein n=1 Tax=Carpinus fangiana TaxID=176857 RepID=A0A660KST5_9ROSI|nr:hypothetical protein FH972_010957 [Carpinus fangiana]